MNVRYFSIGALIYASVSALWIVIAYFVGEVTSRWFVGLAILCIALLVGVAIVTLLQADPFQLTDPNSAKLGQQFGIIFAIEGISIGLSSGILSGLGLTDWIVPVVALIVGLHFLPLAYLLKLSLDYVLGAAIILLVVNIVLFKPPTRWVDFIASGMAVLLWLAGWGRIWLARQAILSISRKMR